MKRRKVKVFLLDPSKVAIGPLAMRTLPPGEAAMMPIMMESKVGVTSEEAQRLVPEARKIADRHPDDPAVLAALAEAEFDAGNDDAAIAAADRALAIDPRRINAHIQKGYALSRKVRSGVLPKESWKDVRTQFIKANQVENDHPIPLVQFYLGYLEEDQPPTKNAIDGLEWALQLAPFDPSLRWLVAQQMISDERFKEAALTLAPLAYSPHPGEHTDRARQLLKDVEARLGAVQ
jgi:cytochrome c-type biogenesis protein CcmH/NrfG